MSWLRRIFRRVDEVPVEPGQVFMMPGDDYRTNEPCVVLYEESGYDDQNGWVVMYLTTGHLEQWNECALVIARKEGRTL